MTFLPKIQCFSRFAAHLVSCLALILAISFCTESPIFDKKPESGSNLPTPEAPTPYSRTIDINSFDWSDAENLLDNGCSQSKAWLSYDLQDIVTENDGPQKTVDKIYLGIDSAQLATVTDDEIHIYLSRQLAASVGAKTGALVGATASLDFPRKTRFHYLIKIELDSGAITFSSGSEAGWSSISAPDSLASNLAGDKLALSFLPSELPDMPLNPQGVGLLWAYFDSTPEVVCGQAKTTLTPSINPQAYDYLSLDFIHGIFPNAAGRLKPGLGAYTHSLSSDSANDFWPKNVEAFKKKNNCTLYSAFDADKIWIGMQATPTADSDIVIAIQSVGSALASLDATGSSPAFSGPGKFHYYLQVSDLTSPNVIGYSVVDDAWQADLGISAAYYQNGNFIKLEFDRDGLLNQDLYLSIARIKGGEIDCSSFDSFSGTQIQKAVAVRDDLYLPPVLQ